MPDGARLTAALSLALIAFIVSGQIMPLMPEETDFGLFTPVNMLLGVACGWIVMGKRAGRGITPAINNGITGVILLVLWALLVQGSYEMVQLALNNRFGGPFEAVGAVFRLSAEYGTTLFQFNIILTLLVGGVLAGLATEYAWRTWR